MALTLRGTAGTFDQRDSCTSSPQVAASVGPRKNARHDEIRAASMSSVDRARRATPPPVESLKVGDTLTKVMLLDQNEETHHLDHSVEFVFFAREMEGGAVIRALLEQEGPEYLQNNKALYIADISGMPTLIANMIAIPKMQEERPYPTLLDRDGTATAAFPSEEGRVTVMALDRLRVKGVRYRGTIDGIKEAVAKGN
jgi:hypothetical protein